VYEESSHEAGRRGRPTEAASGARTGATVVAHRVDGDRLCER
jgi:hypothetical protein